MGKKINELKITTAERMLSTIVSVSGRSGTTRLFNFAMNFNTDEIQSILEHAYKSLHKKPEDFKEYEGKLRQVMKEYCSIPESKMREQGIEPQVALIPEKYMNAFNEEADRLKKEYQEAIDEWQPLHKENVEFKEENTIEVELYTIPTESKKGDKVVPDLKPQEEFWLRHFFDYSRELGEDIPDISEPKDIEHPHEIEDRAVSSNGEPDESEEPEELSEH